MIKQVDLKKNREEAEQMSYLPLPMPEWINALTL